MSRRKGLVAAMEDEALLVEGGGESAGAPEELATLPEAEISEGAGEIEGDATAIEDAEVDAETLGDVQDVMADSVETGEGLSPEAAEMADVVVESITRRLGIKTRIMPSMESFGSTNSRKAATMLAMEQIGEAIVRVWVAIKEAILTLWNKIVEFVKKLIDGNYAIEKSAKELKSKIAQLKVEPSEKTFDDSGICKAFGTNDIKVDNVKKVLAAHKAFCERSALIEAAIKKSVEAVDAQDPSAKVEGPVEALCNFVGSGIKRTKEESTTPLNVDNFLINGECINVTTLFSPPSEGAAGELVFSYSFDKSEKAAGVGSDVAILSKQDMTSICDTVIDLAKDNNKLAANVQKAKTQVDALCKGMDKIISDLKSKSKTGDDAAKTAAQGEKAQADFARKVIGTVSNKIATFASTIGGKNVKAGKAALNYVSKCANKYKAA